MSLIAFAIDANPGFVAFHHLVRVVFVLVMVPLMVSWFGQHPEAPATGGSHRTP